MNRDLLVALGHLTPDQREVVTDRHVVGRTLSQVADTLGVSKNEVWRLERQGLQALRLELRP